MEGLVVPGARVWLAPATTPNRKLRWTWSLTERDGVMVGADTSLPNRLVRAMLEARALPGVRRWRELHPEYVHAPGSRVDFRLITAAAPHDIEVKNCHLVYPDGRAYFPDSVSERATRHLQVLAREARRGMRATVLFVVQRPDPVAVRPSAVHDPAFAEAARRAAKAGVRFRALRVHATPAAVQVLGELPVDLERYDLEPVKRWREDERTRSGWQRSARKG
jgi:sugar fermentation stimulation protein A